LISRAIFVFGFLHSLTWAARPQVEIRANERWVVIDGQPRQLTSDGRSKLQAELSPSATRIAYYEQCPQSENCLTSVIILDLEGRRLQAFRPMAEAIPPGGPCASILGISWLSETTIAAECHYNPSVSEYVETDLTTGKSVKHLLGYGFTPSPDRKCVAHVGPIVHWAAPVDQSNYFFIDGASLYPHPTRGKPVVHEIIPGFSWSADSQRVAFVDCVSDWIAKGIADDGATPAGELKNRRCSIAVVARTGQFARFSITVADAKRISFSWDGPHRLSARFGRTVTKLRIHD